MIKLEGVNGDRIILSAPSCEDWLYLSPKEVLDSIKELQRGLFAWHELTGEPLDKKECH